MTRREFLHRSPLVMLALVLMPRWLVCVLAENTASPLADWLVPEKPFNDPAAFYSKVTVPSFEIGDAPMIPITQIKERRFEVVQRSLNLGKAETKEIVD
jgi:hypothetical protein